MDILTYGLLNKKVEEAKNVSGEKITEAVNTYLDENPPTTGATAEQAAQINKNVADIDGLKGDIAEISEDVYSVIVDNRLTDKRIAPKGSKRVKILEIHGNTTKIGNTFISSDVSKILVNDSVIFEVPSTLKSLKEYGHSLNGLDNYIDIKNKAYHKRIGVVDFGDVNFVWTNPSPNRWSSEMLISTIKIPSSSNVVANALAEQFTMRTQNGSFTNGQMSVNQDGRLWVASETKPKGMFIYELVSEIITDLPVGVVKTEISDNDEIYVKNDNGEILNARCSIEYTISKNNKGNRNIFNIPSFWQPSTVDSGYSMPRPLESASRTHWTASNKYLYYDFIANYYDKYVGEHKDGYKVVKRSLGQDSSNYGYELFEYQFIPKNYTKTVLLSSGMNANEISGIWGIATFVKEMMERTEERMSEFHDNVRFCIIPIICPHSFDQDTLQYYSANGVNLNQNFNFKHSWSENFSSSQYRGDYPDSENETKILKAWVNSYASEANLWVDCHSDHSDPSARQHRMCSVISSDVDVYRSVKNAEEVYKRHYYDIGLASSEDNTEDWIDGTGTSYPKTRYSYEMSGVHAIMIEQTIGTTTYGSDGQTINDDYGIKNYVAMLRLFISAGLIA